MTTVEVRQYFQYHNANMKLLKIGYEELRDQIKQLYRSKDAAGTLIYSLPDTNKEKIAVREKERVISHLLSGIQVSWAEESIKRLLYEPDVFTNQQRNYLLESPALDQRWYKGLHITFCIAYDLIPATDPLCEKVKIIMQKRNLGDQLVNQYFELRDIVTDYLTPNFSIRNKVQHGEWEYAFRNDSKEFALDLTTNVGNENIITTTSRFTLVNAFYQMLVDLGRFKSNAFAIDSIQTPFEYFYSHYMKKINYEIKNIADPKLADFIDDIWKRELRGLLRRAK